MLHFSSLFVGDLSVVITILFSLLPLNTFAFFLVQMKLIWRGVRFIIFPCSWMLFSFFFFEQCVTCEGKEYAHKWLNSLLFWVLCWMSCLHLELQDKWLEYDSDCDATPPLILQFWWLLLSVQIKEMNGINSLEHWRLLALNVLLSAAGFPFV